MAHKTSALHYALYALIIFTVANVSFIGILIHVIGKLAPPERAYSYIGDDFPAQLPLKLPSAGLVLGTGEPHFGLRADDEWGTQFPPSDGFTDLGPANRTFLVSMVHQLHCLDVMRVGFVTNRTGFAHHVEHCLRYMRQIVLCNADTTLEPDHPGVKDGKLTHAAGGVGSVHRCKDWTAVRRYLEENPAHDLGNA